MQVSARNQLQGTVVSVALGTVMAEVRIRIDNQEVVAAITRTAAEGLGLKVGEPAVAIIKATSVMVGKP
jgi:molybdopterin-binding protein